MRSNDDTTLDALKEGLAQPVLASAGIYICGISTDNNPAPGSGDQATTIVTADGLATCNMPIHDGNKRIQDILMGRHLITHRQDVFVTRITASHGGKFAFLIIGTPSD